MKYLNPEELDKYVDDHTIDNEMNYVLIDEIQKVNNFEAVLNVFLHRRNLDIYVIESNSKVLSSDIITEFRGSGDEVRIFPLSFSKFYNAYEGEKRSAWEEYITYGRMP